MQRKHAKIAGWVALGLALVTGVSYAVRGTADGLFWGPLSLTLASALLWASVFAREAGGVIRSRRARQGANALVYSLAVGAILVLAQALIVNNDLSLDLSKDKSFTLADETVKTVKALDQKVMVYAFFSPENRPPMEDLLKRVKKVNPGSFDFEFVNLNRKPLLAQELGVRTLGTTVVQAGDKKESISSSREEDLLNALIKVSSGGKKKVYFLAGHQEASVDDPQPMGATGLRKGLESATFMVASLNFGAQAKASVPEDASALILAGPRTDLLAAELNALSAYLARGGRVLAALDPRVEAPRFKAWLAQAGVLLGEDIVIDMNPFIQLSGGSPLAPIIQAFDPSHVITRDLARMQGQAIFPQTRTVGLGKLPEGAQGTVLARSLPTAFGWTGSGNQAPAKAGPSDKKGPLELMVAIEAPNKGPGSEKPSRLVVLGTSGLLSNQAVAIFNNQDLVVNGLRWLADEEKRIALAPKSPENSPLLLDRARLAMVWWSVILLSLAALGGGFIAYLLRRRAVA